MIMLILIFFILYSTYSLYKLNYALSSINQHFITIVGKPGPLPAGFGPRRQILTRLDREVWNFEIKMLKVK